MNEPMRRIALYGLGLLLASVLALTYATTSRAKAGGPLLHTCSVTDRAFIETAETNMTAVELWGQQYVDGEAAPSEVGAESGRAAKIVGATAPTDPSLGRTRTLLVGMFTEYRRAMEPRAQLRDAGASLFPGYALANFAAHVAEQ